ncbi:protein DENND6B-like isoform X1 [Leptotrombidium deliense]|uniref:Protein DENND6B-like isoform X1 n=1 Tax=Leptotrombidium deliense TaxID=299467 RepID=A0A443SM65_9ACAR|nr:protein DENND6B-like isoform X1 [Leptotrombidium deliense]
MEDKCSADMLDESTILPWDRFSNWIYCVAVVTFDIEIGQSIEHIYPSHIKLTEREKTNICYLAFPDSNSGCMGDTNFHFRTRLCSMRRRSVSIHNEYNRNCFVSQQADPSYFYGFVYFRQVKDKTARRGYFQKSVVLLSRLPFFCLYSHVVSLIAPDFFEFGVSALETACREIDKWQPPVPGTVVNLPLMDRLIRVQIPHKNENLSSLTLIESLPSQLQKTNLIQPCSTLASLYELNIFKCFLPIISHVQLLWELVLTSEPILVMAPTPDTCSEMVQSLVSTIWPLRFASDFRPFFTIHDSEFKEYTTKTQAPPPVILGVTNPFFGKTLQHWPHIIRIGEYGNQSSNLKLHSAGNVNSLDCKPGVYTKYKPFLQKDRSILKKLLKGMESKRPPEVQIVLLRRYFMELTQSFLMPLERYLTSLMPLQKIISPYKATPLFPPFNPEEFLKTLETSGPQLTSGIKGDWSGLYKRFFRSPNFSSWYECRYEEVDQALKVLHIKAISEANLLEWIANKAEVEIVDLVLKIKEKLTAVEKERLPVTHDTVSKLESRLKDVINSLPDDLQQILLK